MLGQRDQSRSATGVLNLQTWCAARDPRFRAYQRQASISPSANGVLQWIEGEKQGSANSSDPAVKATMDPWTLECLWIWAS